MTMDNYFHKDTSIIYITENIPGPIEQNREYEEIIENFNSQLIHYCNCKSKCLPSTCECLQTSGGTNYDSYHSDQCTNMLYRLNTEKNVNVYPIFECNNNCKCSEQCGNRLVQNGPIETLYVKVCENKSKGLGLYANSLIRKGSFICEYAGEVITKRQAQIRHKYNKLQGRMNYILCLNEHCNESIVQTFVDPSDIGNIGRYINHSCEANCEIVPVRINSPIVKLAVFSIVDIYPNTEITFDYGASVINNCKFDNSKRKLCVCNSLHCKGFLPYSPV